jgi:hypothetical protein
VAHLFDNLVFTMAGKSFKLTSTDYLVDGFQGRPCTALINATTNNIVSLGTAFFNGFFVKMNFETKEITLAPRNPSTQISNYNLTVLDISFIIGCSLLFLFCAIFCLTKVWFKRRKIVKERNAAEALIAADLGQKSDSEKFESEYNFTEDD